MAWVWFVVVVVVVVVVVTFRIAGWLGTVTTWFVVPILAKTVEAGADGMLMEDT